MLERRARARYEQAGFGCAVGYEFHTCHTKIIIIRYIVWYLQNLRGIKSESPHLPAHTTTTTTTTT
jgi:hypothetical protein